MASGRRGGWRYTRTVIVFAGEKSKNAASPDEERCSALSRFLHQGKRNNTRQSRTASSGGFTACSGNSHPLLVPSRLLQNSGNNRAGQQVLVQCCLFSKWRYVAHAAVSGTVSHRLHELRQEDDASPPPSTSANEKRRPPLSRFIAQAQAKSPPAGGRRQGIPQSPLRFHSWLLSEHRRSHPRRASRKKSRFAFFHKGRSLPLFVCAALFSPLQKKFAWLREAAVPPGNVSEHRHLLSTNQLQPWYTQQRSHCSAAAMPTPPPPIMPPASSPVTASAWSKKRRSILITSPSPAPPRSLSFAPSSACTNKHKKSSTSSTSTPSTRSPACSLSAEVPSMHLSFTLAKSSKAHCSQTPMPSFSPTTTHPATPNQAMPTSR